MPLGPSVVGSRNSSEQIVLESQNFARFVARRKGVSAKALSTAIRLLSEGLVEAMSEGYAVRLYRLGLFEVRELPPRNRYHRLKRENYISPATTVVRFKKSENLNKRVRSMSKERLDKMEAEPTIRPAVRQ